MNPRRRAASPLAAALTLPLALLVLPLPAAAQQLPPGVDALIPVEVPPAKDRRWRRLGPELIAIVERTDNGRVPLRPDTPAADRRPFSLVQPVEETVVIDAVADGDPADLVAALEALGARDISVFKRMVSARLPVASIEALAEVASLRFARPATALTNVGATTSQADPAMRTDDARSVYSVDGSGVTVGVLSDSFDCGSGTTGSIATDVGTGDLPSGIEILADLSCNSGQNLIDEGRAMGQLIHDVAPGSELSFHTAFGGQADFALGIQELAGCPAGSEPGCTPAADPAEVVVDDVGYFATPMFQDGVIAQAVDVVHDAGVAYFSSAGNSARASYESPFRSSGITPLDYPFGPGDAHDFDPGPGTDIYQRVVFPGGSTAFSLQWDEPFFSVSGAPGSASDLDICFYDEPVTGLLGCIAADNVGSDPVEVATLGLVGTVNIAIVKFSGPAPGAMKYVMFRSNFAFADTYATVNASTLYGQNNARGAIAIGAADYRNTPEFGTTPPLLEAFSSAGGTPIRFDTAGNRLPVPQLRRRPQFVAPDGTNTTFFGSDADGDGFPNFFGTSAAAPHAAAAAALLLEASAAALTPDGVESVLSSSAEAQDMRSPGYDFDSGYGLLDGLTATGSVDEPDECDGVDELTLRGINDLSGAVFSAETSIRYEDGRFVDFDAHAPVHVLDDGAVVSSGGVTTFVTTCTL